ncbi:MAG: D-ornithine 4,5-aminomutase subunit OraS, partial [Anaerovoracaceae bacterium]
MKREDDFEVRRMHIANLTDEELYDRFWALTQQVVEPLLELGRKNTTPSIERAVLLRMGISSL